MNRSVKRLLALAGSATVGVFAAVAIATPAQAHHPTVTGVAECLPATGKWKITWTISNGNWGGGKKMTIIGLEHEPNTALTPSSFPDPVNANGSVTTTQEVAGNIDKATVKLRAEGSWPGVQNQWSTWGKPQFPTGDCNTPPPAPDPTAKFRADCDGTIAVTITNTHTAAVSVTVTGINGPVNVPAGADKAVTVTVPAGTAGPIQVKKGDKVLGETPAWTRPESCAKPSSLGESTCTTFKVSVTNPPKGQSTEATVTYGSQVKKVTVAPGKTEVVELSPSSESEAVVSYAGWANYTEKVKYTKPADCAGLPQTGASTATYIGTGIGVAILGFFAIYFGRRRLARLRRLAA